MPSWISGRGRSRCHRGEDKSFDGKHFIAGARAAYEMIVTAYAEGDRRTLKNLLSRDVYDGFEAAIRERESQGETAESRFVSIDKSDITDAELRGRTAQITMRFVSQLVSVTRNREGAVIDGSPTKSPTSPTCGPSPATCRRATPIGSWSRPKPVSDHGG